MTRLARIFLVLFAPVVAWGQLSTNPAGVSYVPGTLSRSISAAINSPTCSNGCTINLAAGTYTWSSSSSPVALKTGIFIVGSGTGPILNYATGTLTGVTP